MPHFYRYRGDDEDLTARSRTPGPGFSVTSATAKTDEAHIRCLGMGADISIPAGDDKNKVNLNILFYELDKTIQGLREENKQLRAEVDYLKERGTATRNLTVVAPPAANGNHSGDLQLDGRLGRLEAELERLAAGTAELRTSVIEGQRDSGQLRQALAGLETRHSDHEAAMAKALAELSATAAPVPSAATTAVVEPGEAPAAVDISQQIAAITDSKLASLRSLAVTPFSVLFDAVRCEDWIGQDNFLPFTKVNVNLGGGLDVNSGRFTAPTSGLYFFNLNVYGAPRDGVVLCIKANEFQEIASCSGVGKASQSVVVDLDEKDTVGVYVNDKSKLVDTTSNRFTHFIGFLIRPREMMY